jgi:glycerol-3-phosphate dehydrogenase (NAD+)
MWVFEEEVETNDSKYGDTFGGKPAKLTEIINKVHENIKYLPGIPLPNNIVADPSIESTVKDASILIFNLPQTFVMKTCDQIKGHLPFARGISCVKGVDVSDSRISLFSEQIMEKLGIYCGALSGANLAPEVAAEKWCETTIGYDAPPVDLSPDTPKPSAADGSKINEQRQLNTGQSSVTLHAVPEEYVTVDDDLLIKLFSRPYFHVTVVKDVAGVGLAGALKNIVALAVGFVDGAGWGDNAKAAIFRIGILEMIKFGEAFFPDSFDPQTFTRQSAGVADLVASCLNGRNFSTARAAAERGVDIREIEKTEMNGQTLEGVSTADRIYKLLEANKKVEEFPLFSAVYSKYRTFTPP